MDQGFEVKPGGGGVRVPLGAAFTPGARVRYPNTVPAGHCVQQSSRRRLLSADYISAAPVMI